MGLGLMNDTPFYMSSLKNDANYAYAKHFHFTADDLSDSTSLTCPLGDESFNIYKILISTDSLNSESDVLGFHVCTTNDEITTEYEDIFVDLSNSVGINEQDMEIDPNTNLLFTPIDLDEVNYQTRIVFPAIEFDIVIFCKPKN